MCLCGRGSQQHPGSFPLHLVEIFHVDTKIEDKLYQWYKMQNQFYKATLFRQKKKNIENLHCEQYFYFSYISIENPRIFFQLFSGSCWTLLPHVKARLHNTRNRTVFQSLDHCLVLFSHIYYKLLRTELYSSTVICCIFLDRVWMQA